jgi:hypothetical protein
MSIAVGRKEPNQYWAVAAFLDLDQSRSAAESEDFEQSSIKEAASSVPLGSLAWVAVL